MTTARSPGHGHSGSMVDALTSGERFQGKRVVSASRDGVGEHPREPCSPIKALFADEGASCGSASEAYYFGLADVGDLGDRLFAEPVDGVEVGDEPFGGALVVDGGGDCSRTVERVTCGCVGCAEGAHVSEPGGWVG